MASWVKGLLVLLASLVVWFLVVLFGVAGVVGLLESADRGRLLADVVGPGVPEIPRGEKWLHPPPPAGVFHQHIVGELREESRRFGHPCQVCAPEVGLDEEVLQSINGPVPRVDISHGPP